MPKHPSSTLDTCQLCPKPPSFCISNSTINSKKKSFKIIIHTLKSTWSRIIPNSLTASSSFSTTLLSHIRRILLEAHNESKWLQSMKLSPQMLLTMMIIIERLLPFLILLHFTLLCVVIKGTSHNFRFPLLLSHISWTLLSNLALLYYSILENNLTILP